MTLLLLLGCGGPNVPKDSGDVPPLDTALPPIQTTGLVDSGTPTATSGGELDPRFWDEDGNYIGLPMITSLHQSCEDGNWAYHVETIGHEDSVQYLQWNLGTPPEDRPPDTEQNGGEFGFWWVFRDSYIDPNKPWNGTRSSLAWDDTTPPGAPKQPDCAQDVDSVDLVVAFYLLPTFNVDSRMHCIMFGSDSDAVIRDPQHHRAFETDTYYRVPTEFIEDIGSCTVIPWPTKPVTFSIGEFNEQ